MTHKKLAVEMHKTDNGYGYIVEKQEVEGETGTHIIDVAYTPDGQYIGLPARAEMLAERGIAPEYARDGDGICTVGFCEAEQKWYGWGRAGMRGYGIGDAIRFNEVGYAPRDSADHIRGLTASMVQHGYSSVAYENVTRGGEQIGWLVTFVPPPAVADVPGRLSGMFVHLPQELGRGDAPAETLGDAREMAVTFAREADTAQEIGRVRG